MKKAAILCFLLAALSVGLLGGAAVRVDAAREDVTLEETILYGDPAAAEGLTVHARMRYGDLLFWEIDHTVGGDTTADCTYGQTDDTSEPASPTVEPAEGVVPGELTALAAQPEAGRLFAVSREDGADVLTVLSLDGTAVLQKLSVPANADGVRVTELHPDDGCLVLIHGMQSFDLFTAGADGSYALRFSHALAFPARLEHFGYLAAEHFCAAFDGERLAVAAPYLRYDLHWTQGWDGDDGPVDPDTDYYLAVYDADGLTFAADCTLPLTHPYTEDYDPGRLLWGRTPLSLRWDAAPEGGIP